MKLARQRWLPSVVNLTLLYSGLRTVIPAFAGIQTSSLRKQGFITEKLGSCLHRKPWIPDQVRNDKICKLISESCITRRLMVFCGVAALALVVFTSSLANAACVGLGCDGPVHEAYIICCNQLAYDPGKEGTGADRTVDCDKYMRERNISPGRTKSICNQLKGIDQLCPELAAACTPNENGNDCYGKMPEEGGLFAQNKSKGNIRIHSEPSSDSSTVAEMPNGARIIYRQMKQVDGQTWYYVIPPGKPAGWVSSSDVSCSRRGEPPRYFVPYRPPEPPPTYRTTPSYGGARG